MSISRIAISPSRQLAAISGVADVSLQNQKERIHGRKGGKGGGGGGGGEWHPIFVRQLRISNIMHYTSVIYIAIIIFPDLWPSL